MSNYIALLLGSSFVSITLFETLCFLFLTYIIFSRRINLKRSLESVGLLMYSISTLIGTTLFNPSMLLKALEQALLPGIFLAKFHSSSSLINRVNVVLITLGSINLLVATAVFLKRGEFKPLWGGPFETALISSLLCIYAFTYSLLLSKRGSRRAPFLLVAAGVILFAFTLLVSKRALILALSINLLILLFLLRRFINSKLVFGFLFLVLSVSIPSFMYLKERDERFKTLYEIATLKRGIDRESANVILSNRLYLFEKGMEVIKEDVKEKRWLNLILGHGVRPGYNLNLKREDHREGSYESIFILSEFIERGAVGLGGILLIYIAFFKRVFTLRIKSEKDILALPLFLLLGLHLISSIFTYFWDALLPAYLLAYAVAVKYLNRFPSP